VNENGACDEVADTLDCANPACVAGTCVAGVLPEGDSTACTDEDGNPCSVAGCESGVCVQAHLCEPEGKPECEITIGDFIWTDANGDGLQDSEPGIADVDLSLIECVNGELVEDTITTNASGLYAFTVSAVKNLDTCVPETRDFRVEVDSSNFANNGALEGLTGSPPNVGGDDAIDSDCDPTTHETVCTPFGPGTTDLTVDCGFIPPPTVIGCRVTGGGITPGASDKNTRFGGQVGSPCGCIGCFDDLQSVQGQWTHDRKKQLGRFHASEYSSLVCDLDDGEGPLPRPAPANKVCFAGKGMLAEKGGKRDKEVAFRVEIEDRGEPASGKNSGAEPDVYRIRMWFPGAGQTAEDLLDNVCCLNPEPVGIGLPNIDDGGQVLGGNLQIHPSTPNTNRGICPPPEEVEQCFQQALPD